MKTIKSLLFSFTVIFLFSTSDTKAQMFWNQTASFLGNLTSYVSVPNSASLNITGSFSLEAWVNPVNTNNKGVISKGGTFLKYAIRITSSRIVISTNGAPRLSSRTANLIPINTWTHVAATYNSSTNEFKIFINGQLDTMTTVTGAAPTTNSDSLYIGFSGASTAFNGQLDEARIWNREILQGEVEKYYRTSLGTSSGKYSGLVLSTTFQKESSSGTKFTARDFSGNENNGNPRNVTAVDQSYRPLQTISQNDNIELDGNEDYLSAKDTSTLNPTNAVTLECWVYPRISNQTCFIISKGIQYAILLENGIFKFSTNGSTASSGITLPVNQWSKLTVQYLGAPYFHVNGKRVLNAVEPLMGNLVTGTDSLFIGGLPGPSGDFNGFIDEVRILSNKFNDDEIYHMANVSIDKSNAPAAGDVKICYNLDGTLNDNAESGGPKLNFRNEAGFSHPGSNEYKPVSPLIRDIENKFPKGFYQSQENRRIPLLGGSIGNSNYLIKINLDAVINDIDIMVGLNHTDLSSLNITIIAPNLDSVRIVTGLSTKTADNSLVTVFDDQADSSFATDKYVSFHTTIKPQNNMNSVFAGDNCLGIWKIMINDIAAGDTGVLNMCGIKINNMPLIENNFSLHSLLQGFYDPSTDLSIKDTMKMQLRNRFSPYEVIDSCSRKMNQYGESLMSFKNIINDTLYYISLKHRNSIEIWSSSLVIFKYSFTSRIFYLSTNTVYGNNEINVDTNPVRFAMYGGDVNQDGVIDLVDVSLIDNDTFNFQSGYLPTDINGDDIIDLSDAVITDNNAFNFIAKITP